MVRILYDINNILFRKHVFSSLIMIVYSRSTSPKASTPVGRFVERPARKQAFPVPLDGDPNLQRASSSDILGVTFPLSSSLAIKLSISSATDGEENDTMPAIMTNAGNAKTVDRRVLSDGEQEGFAFVCGDRGW